MSEAEVHISDPGRNPTSPSMKSDDNSPPTGSLTPLFEDENDFKLEEEEDVGSTVSETEDTNTDSTRRKSIDDLFIDEDQKRINNITDSSPHLMAYLDESYSDNSNAIASSSEEDFNDSSIEAEEEQAIRAELKSKKEKEASAIPGPVTLRRLSQSQQARNRKGIDSDDSDSGDDDNNNNDNDEDGGFSDSSSWGNEFLDGYFDLPDSQGTSNQLTNANQNQSRQEEFDEEGDFHDINNDDSYLWQYFFSSEEEDGNASGEFGPGARSRQRRHSKNKSAQPSRENSMNFDDEEDYGGSTDEDIPLLGRGPLPAEQIAKSQPSGYIPSGDSTDEDDGVPPERKRRKARGTKAIEVLGNNSFSARPPVLGSWRIKGDKNIGIIDGLTTRTLSPPSQPQQHQQHQGNGQPSPGMESPFDTKDELGDQNLLGDIGDFTDFGDDHHDLTPTRQNSTGSTASNPVINDEDLSDLDLLELGDFINTEGMSSEENEHYEFDLDLDTSLNPQQHDALSMHHLQQQPQRQFRSPIVSPYLYRNRLSSANVPMSAFRNRGSPYVSNPAYPNDNMSPAPWRRRSSHGARRRDSTNSPGSIKKRGKKMRTGSRSGLTNSTQFLGNEEPDFFGDLIEIGDLGPLFEEE